MPAKILNRFFQNLGNLIGKGFDEDKIFEELEEALIQADIGIMTSEKILKFTREHIREKKVRDADTIREWIKNSLIEILEKNFTPFKVNSNGIPYVVLFAGVNGTGKTTTIAKLAYRLKREGKKVILVAGDTYRAAAIEQLERLGDKVGVDVIKQKEGADPAAVVFDSIVSSKARGIDVVLVDTAGRMHTKENLIEELKKIKRVCKKEIESAPQETLLVLDATTGKNALSQATVFKDAVDITGVVLTKLDGTAKGGIVVTIVDELGIPVKLIGTGERLDSLSDFSPQSFVEQLVV